MKVNRLFVVSILLLTLYMVILFPFAGYMSSKPYAEKLGLIPRPFILQVGFSDYQELVGASILTKVLFYFGALIEASEDTRQLLHSADYPAMSRAVHTSLQLDPYNMDGYYFGQSFLAWDVGQFRLATELLEYGMQYRTWDWQLPFYAGFNYAYFLNDQESAARMYMRAGELSGFPLFQTLASRYLQEVGRTRMAIDYLLVLEKGARDPMTKNIYQVRIDAFTSALTVEKARDRFRTEKGKWPRDIHELVTERYLNVIPKDPYGGEFYLDLNKSVRSTSKFSYAGVNGEVPLKKPQNNEE